MAAALAALGIALAVAAPAARAADVPATAASSSTAPEAAPVPVPVPDRAPDVPPPGIAIAPGVTLSGYATAQLLVPRAGDAAAGASAGAPGSSADAADEDPQSADRARLNLSHFSLVGWWEPAPAWKVLAEVDFQDLVQLPAHDDHQDGRNSSAYVALDRLHVDWRGSDALALRAGKFLTPIGRWNQDHSDPQTWTVSRPLLSESAFPETATGLMVFGSVPLGSQWVDYQAWASDGDDLRTSPRTDPFGRAVGVRVATSLDPDLQVGVSLARFTQAGRDVEHDLVGADLLWRWRRIEWSAEALARRTADPGAAAEHGGFLQVAAPALPRWWVVARVESYRRSIDPSVRRTALAGVVYRSGRHWVFKTEWAWSDRAPGLPTGLLASLTLQY